MDVLRKELNAIYESQRLADEHLDHTELERCRHNTAIAVEVDGNCRVVTDAADDRCYIYGGGLAFLLGLCDAESYAGEADSGDEDVIYNRIHPEDLVDKRMLEYEFFKFVDTLPPDEKLHHKATCRFRIMDRHGRYVHVDNSTQIMRLSPRGKIWLILCCYTLSPDGGDASGISARIVNGLSGEITDVGLSDRRAHILTPREKEILRLIGKGKASKQIADILGISIHTVSRHRQNILGKLSVGNSSEAIRAATLMKLA